MAEDVKKFGHINADETMWMSFHRIIGKQNFMDWMWVIAVWQRPKTPRGTAAIGIPLQTWL
jgi:hypothetical protein